MGKTTKPKLKKVDGTLQSVTTYFSKGTSKQLPESASATHEKMAAATESDENDDTAISRHEFILTIKQLEANIAEQIHEAVHAAIQPLTSELKTITETLSEVAQAAESALNGVTAAHDDIQRLQEAKEWSQTKLMALENKMRDRNLKFHGLPEQAEERRSASPTLRHEFKFSVTFQLKLFNIEDCLDLLHPSSRNMQFASGGCLPVNLQSRTKDHPCSPMISRAASVC
ncbi:UNVERIFIED_CONTAM: hypothetical protein K2H54_066477 [Gekko kuhli]